MAKGDVKLAKAKGGQLAQVWVEMAGYTRKTEGSFSNVTTLWCNDDGNVTVTYDDNTEETLSYVSGDMATFFPGPVTIDLTGTAGTFSFMVA